ncbi:MAG TPA: cupin [Burkholderiaceae bacterium]
MQQQPFRVWVDDPAAFSTRRIERLHHNFHEHPLMQMPELAKLARELAPTRQTRFIKPGTTQRSEFSHDGSSPDGRTIDEVFARIEEPGSWVALYNVETVPRYAEFLAQVIGTVQPYIERDQGRAFMMTGFIFISAPPSVTPFHIDRENNFWLQIHGRKVMNVWHHTDREVVAGKDVEDFIIFRALERVRLAPGHEARSEEFDVRAGDGVYFPATSPHMTRTDASWTQPDERVSVSIGVTFYTDLTRKHAHVHQVNEVLRRLGANPATPGESDFVDTLKAPLGRLIGNARYRKRKSEPPPGF